MKLIVGFLVLVLFIVGCVQPQVNPPENITPPKNITPTTNITPPQNQTQQITNISKNESGDELDELFTDDLDKALSDLETIETVTDPAETDGMYCDSADDCWCRVFTGAAFIPGKNPWYCNLETNRCESCIYE